DDKRRDVIAVKSIEFERGRRTGAGLIIRYKYTARGQALKAGSILRKRRTFDHPAGVVGLIASAGVGAASLFAGNKATRIALSGVNAPRGGIHGSGQTAYPAIEIIPTQNAGRTIPRLVVFWPSQMGFAEQG